MTRSRPMFFRLGIVIWPVLVTLLLTACGSAEPPKTYTIGVVNLSSNLDTTVEAFKEGMTELGYTEGENITYIYGGPVAMDQLDAVAQGLVEQEVDMILSVTTPATQAAQRATADNGIPVVFVPVNDPVGAGIVDSLTNPGGNITGVSFSYQEERRLKWLIDVVPTIEQVFIAHNPQDRSSSLALETVKATAEQLGVELIVRETSSSEEVAAAIEDIPEEVDAIFVLPDSLVGRHTADFVALGLPTSVANVTTMQDYQALTSFGIEQSATGKQAARLADQIFRGINPADLPVEIGEFFAAVNLKASESIGIEISDDILQLADIIIR